MKKWIKRIFWGLLLGLFLAVLLALQTQPSLPPAAEVKTADLSRAKDFLKRNDPRQIDGGSHRLVTISEKDLNLLLGQAALYSRSGAAQVRLHAGLADLRIAYALPKLGLWLNVEALLHETQRLPEFERVRVGRLPVPAWMANLALRSALKHLPKPQDVQLAKDLIERIGFGEQYAQVRYQWQQDSMARVMALVWPAPEQQRAMAYHEHLRQLSEAYPANSAVSLAALLPPMFDLVRQRSHGDERLMTAENRAAILTLTLHASGKSWAVLMPAARHWTPVRPLVVSLGGRDDFAQHFLVSAALAIEGGGPLADAIGVYKEVADSRGGSGFSFNDIAADRAGTRFGVLAAKNPARLQIAMSAGLQERDFMPDVSDLPEFLTERDFQQRYGAIGSPVYRETMAEIETRLAGLKLWK
ncbi:hypothetical protein DBR47_09245 [Paucibacter sp. KBW04]|uniref:hypothetical protein n=1 Tax=Paucibacter sp. KBW04 TaxID=2153361 RepID=UPI000F579FAB|nr:hypothetical protein [Paucibacter sp. KBW04]RQO60532.1 hypothetical protein DBR47_09245 [Paucibacter sp. KBW04]